MTRDNLIRDLLAAIENFDREAGRSVMIQHRGKYNFILDAAKALRQAMDAEKAPEYVAGDVCNKCGAEFSYGDALYCERCYAENWPTS
jgi:predicted Zn-ribbon and HTH transcriptional regulator